jgi:superfamily II DNA or RNA helicase
MARLEELTPGARVTGLVPNSAVVVVATRWHGNQAITLTYRDREGHPSERLLYRSDEAGLEVEAERRTWSFDADGHLFRLVSEARRIRLAYLFDPMLAVHLSLLDPLPHQIKAVYGAMLPRQPLRFLLADDPGAGKTIMAGLLVKELALRGDVRRCLVVAPGGLVTQWQDELDQRFGLAFDIVTRDSVEAARTGNPFAEHDWLIARLDHLARNEDLQAKLKSTDWDMVVVDEAHRMAAHWFGNEVKETKRYQLGRLLNGIARHFLLLTATPHAGKEEDFQLFLALLDPDRFEGRFRDGVEPADVSDIMRRMIKEDLLRFDGRRLFPERRASTVPFRLTDAEARLYAEVTEYVVQEMNRADRLRDLGEGRRGNRVGFALTVLQRRLASSPEAIYQSLVRRRARLEARVADERRRQRGERDLASRAERLLDDLDRDDDPDRFDDLADDELEEVEEELVDEATTARTITELESEIDTLRRLEALAAAVRRSRDDRKWAELSTLLQDAPELRHPDGSRRKLIVFTEHRDTLNYLVQRLEGVVGRSEAVVAIHGGIRREERRRIQEVFTQDKECLVLVATDAAGEGINLQRAHLLVNYDLPWNPNRIEQRFGRIHRIGQEEVCHMWNLVAEETREGDVYRKLLDKLEAQSASLGGRVFDVLGQAFRDVPLRDLLLRAVRYGDDPEVRAQLDEVIDERVGDGLAELVQQQGLAADAMGPGDIAELRAEMQEAEARRLQPRYVQAFFLEAFTGLGGRAREREPGRFEVTHVPAEVRNRRRDGSAAPVLVAYERICFERDLINPRGQLLAELVCPGHPLLEAVIDLVEERHGPLLGRGAILVNEADPREDPYALVYLEHAIADARPNATGGPHVVSRRFEFVELEEAGTTRTATAAPYLDYRPANAEELVKLGPTATAPWLDGKLAERATDVAIEVAVPDHLAVVRARTDVRVQKVRAAVKERLTREINHWDARAVELRAQADAGKQPRMNPDRAQARADELARRLDARLVELDQEQQLRALPPVVVGGALVVPAGLLARLSGERAEPPERYARDTTEVERRAVDAVLRMEDSLGRTPSEMARNNPGFDIRSSTPDGNLVFLEVKGRILGATTVTVTRNEILFGLNAPDRYVLALVEVSEDGRDEVRYLRRPFEGAEAGILFAETSRTFDWRRLWEQGEEPR